MPRVLEATTLRIGVSFHSFTLQTAAAGDPDLTASPSACLRKGVGGGWGLRRSAAWRRSGLLPARFRVLPLLHTLPPPSSPVSFLFEMS